MTKDSHCNRLTNCSQCSKAAEDILVHRVFPKGRHLPVNKCSQNCMLFMLQGELLINSEEYPGTTLHRGQIILQAIDTKIEVLTLTDVEYIVYWFNEPPQMCETYYQDILAGATMPLVYTPLQMSQRITNFMEDMSDYLDDQVACSQFVELKCKELMYLLTCYYPVPQLRNFFYPISSYTESFHYFVMQNYSKVKNVEDFAQLGGYTTTTFRRLFKNTYGIPVYEWILNKKREGILNDLQFTKQRITEISNRYGFDSLSHFAHFCKSSFGDSPRALRTRAARGETIGIITEQQTKNQEPSGE